MTTQDEQTRPPVVDSETGEAPKSAPRKTIETDFESPLGLDSPIGISAFDAVEETTSVGDAPGGGELQAGGGGEPSAEDPASPQSEPSGPAQDPHLSEKAAAYDFINGDPELSVILNDAIARRTGRIPAQPETAPTTGTLTAPQNGETVSRDEFNKLVNTLQHLVVKNAQTEIESFRGSHSDFATVERSVGELVTKHGLPLEQAYLLAKAQNGGQPVSSRPLATVPPAEGSVGGGIRTATPVDPMEEAAELIQQLPRHGRDRLQKALRIAFNGAVKKHA